jgi:hypothetical protein
LEEEGGRRRRRRKEGGGPMEEEGKKMNQILSIPLFFIGIPPGWQLFVFFC